jgi:fructose/tagatose bisphosphate aldolase
MRDRGAGTLTTDHEQGWALGAFSTDTQEITQAICRAAQDAGRPAILQAGADVARALRRAREAVGAVVRATTSVVTDVVDVRTALR